MYQALISDTEFLCKVLTFGSLLPLFVYALFVAIDEMVTLQALQEEGQHISGESLHNLEHFAIFGTTQLLAFWMVFFGNPIDSQQYFVSMVYLSLLALYLYPHLIDERKRYFSRKE